MFLHASFCVLVFVESFFCRFHAVWTPGDEHLEVQKQKIRRQDHHQKNHHHPCLTPIYHILGRTFVHPDQIIYSQQFDVWQHWQQLWLVLIFYAPFRCYCNPNVNFFVFSQSLASPQKSTKQSVTSHCMGRNFGHFFFSLNRFFSL